MGYYKKIIQAQTIDLMSNLENLCEKMGKYKTQLLSCFRNKCTVMHWYLFKMPGGLKSVWR